MLGKDGEFCQTVRVMVVAQFTDLGQGHRVVVDLAPEVAPEVGQAAEVSVDLGPEVGQGQDRQSQDQSQGQEVDQSLVQGQEAGQSLVQGHQVQQDHISHRVQQVLRGQGQEVQLNLGLLDPRLCLEVNETKQQYGFGYYYYIVVTLSLHPSVTLCLSGL